MVPNEAIKNIKLFVMDVDGTLTDGKLFLGNNGEEYKAFNVKDGYAIAVMLKNKGIIPVIITGRISKIVEQRASELGIEYVIQGSNNKAKDLEKIMMIHGITYKNVACIGDDIPDLVLMNKCALSGCPADASDKIKEVASFVSEFKGGEGAVRDYIEWILNNSC